MTRRWYVLIAFCAIAFCSLAPTTPSTDEETNKVTPTGVQQKHTSKRKHRPAAKPTEPKEAVPTPGVPGAAPSTSAVSAIVVNAHNGQVLYEKNPDQLRAPASTTKLLTALIIAETGDLDRDVMVERIDTMAEPVKLNVKTGEHYRRIDLLRALLVKSPNDVARCLARDNAGSVVGFAERMNQRAYELGAVHSHFINPNGLPVAGQYSTARDLSIIARAAYANPIIRSIVCLPRLTFRFADGRTRELENTNKLLQRLSYCNGMKTGYTEAAGKCLIASGARPGKDVIVVVLGDTSGRVWKDAGALLAWGLWNSAG